MNEYCRYLRIIIGKEQSILELSYKVQKPTVNLHSALDELETYAVKARSGFAGSGIVICCQLLLQVL